MRLRVNTAFEKRLFCLFILEADAAKTVWLASCLCGHRHEVLRLHSQTVITSHKHGIPSNDTRRSSEVLHGSPSTHLCRVSR